ncbi:MAG: hypothetical protein VKN60_12235 [Cyanobacteriota bacterium]|nr:hypothetical protein [Cyanobacteriota bacterium]
MLTDETQDISPIYLDIPFYQQLHQTLAVLTSDEIPIPSASAWNCR